MRVCKELDSGVETRVVLNGGKLWWFTEERGLRQGCSLSPLLYDIYLMGMERELARAQVEVKLESAGQFCMLVMLFWWQIQGQSCKQYWMW